jgi:hypothetical protein
MLGYCGSDLASNMDTRLSTTDAMFFLGNCLVSSQSLKRRVVAVSSCETKYIAATTAATQAIWMARLPGELLGREPEVVELKVDNMSSLALARNPVFHERRKHIDLSHHFIRNCLAEGSVSATFINPVFQDYLLPPPIEELINAQSRRPSLIMGGFLIFEELLR